MLGEATITLNIGTVAVPVEIVLFNINSGDRYSSEYRLKEADREHVLIVRHTKEKSRVKGSEVERHNVTYTQNIFPTVLYPQGQTIQAYSVIRNAPELPTADLEAVTGAVMRLTDQVAGELAIWKN